MNAGKIYDCDLFKYLNSQEINLICQSIKTQTFKEGEIIFREGEKGKFMCILLSGIIVVSIKDDNGKEVEVSRIKEGSFFGEMSIFSTEVRSATCRSLTASQMMIWNEQNFKSLMFEHPEISIKIMQRMLGTITMRLDRTGAFLSDMVKWGEDARIRAMHDSFTGLYNRRFFDHALKNSIDNAIETNQPVSLVMVDLDEFGALNNDYSEGVGDQVILAAVDIFHQVFEKSDFLIRYGGDEFSFICPGKDGQDTLKCCQRLKEKLNSIDILRKTNNPSSIKIVGASIGIAVFPQHGKTPRELFINADKAVYAAKEAGRNQSFLYEEKDV